MTCEPLGRRRLTMARENCTTTGWAQEVAGLPEGRYADREKVTPVVDNLNTHTKLGSCAAFEPERASELVRRVDFCYTPKHVSWLNIAKCELSEMMAQCLRRCRIGDMDEPRTQIKLGSTDVNTRQRGVEWRMKIETLAASASPSTRKLSCDVIPARTELARRVIPSRGLELLALGRPPLHQGDVATQDARLFRIRVRRTGKHSHVAVVHGFLLWAMVVRSVHPFVKEPS